MQDSSISTQQTCNQPIHHQAIGTDASSSELYKSGYQQALIDFAVADLLHCIKTYSDTHFAAAWVALKLTETEALAAILIQTLAANLNGNCLSTYLDAIRYTPINTFKPLTKLHIPSPATDLPTAFPDVEMPQFLYGDRLRWKTNSNTTDWGIVIGRFYSFAPHCCRWRWCYLICLDANSPSFTWVKADIAWEDDLEPLETEPVL